jgi:hypothetical protein
LKPFTRRLVWKIRLMDSGSWVCRKVIVRHSWVFLYLRLG